MLEQILHVCLQYPMIWISYLPLHSWFILIVLSTSGKSQNILNAVQTARKIGMYTICITGDRATKLTEMSNMVLHIQSNQTDTIQETYLAAFHVICQAVERAVYADSLRIHKKI